MTSSIMAVPNIDDPWSEVLGDMVQPSFSGVGSDKIAGQGSKEGCWGCRRRPTCGVFCDGRADNLDDRRWRARRSCHESQACSRRSASSSSASSIMVVLRPSTIFGPRCSVKWLNLISLMAFGAEIAGHQPVGRPPGRCSPPAGAHGQAWRLAVRGGILDGHERDRSSWSSTTASSIMARCPDIDDPWSKVLGRMVQPNFFDAGSDKFAGHRFQGRLLAVPPPGGPTLCAERRLACGAFSDAEFDRLDDRRWRARQSCHESEPCSSNTNAMSIMTVPRTSTIFGPKCSAKWLNQNSFDVGSDETPSRKPQGRLPGRGRLAI